LPSDWPPKLRQIIESTEFSRSRDALGIEPRLMDDALEAWTWLLARMPEWGHQVGETPVHTLTFEIPEDGIEVTVFYTFNEKAVTLEDVMVSHPGE